ncbi:HEAT repeat domain-containing protein [Lacipirellula sp.]|uniref:HEAT repeat domain-containing protein n=1 Tax=Lacipirellula sp. TaxID=2691419 RepID=UPI003D105A7F
MNLQRKRTRLDVAVIVALSLLAVPPANGDDPDANALLLAYSHRGDEQAVAELLQQGANPNSLDDNDNTPLHKAIAGDDNLAIVQALAAAGAQLDVANAEGVTPVRLASIRGQRKIYDWLVAENGDVEPPPRAARETTPATHSLDESFKNLRSPDQAARRAAQRRLVFDHKEALPEIFRRVDAGEPIERFADVLAAMGPSAESAVPRLAAKLDDKRHAFGALILINRIRPTAFEQLPAEQQAAAAEAFYQLAIDPSSDVVGGMAVQLLPTLGPTAQPAILKLLGDTNPRLRAAAIRGLLRTAPHDEQIAAVLLKLAQNDPDNDVRLRALSALPVDVPYRDQLRGRSLVILKSFPPHDLSTTDADEQRAINAWRAEVAFAAKAVRQLGAQSVDDLVPLLSPISRPGRLAAIDTIVAMGPPAVPRLIELLAHEDKAVAVSASVALNKLGPPAVPALVDALRSENDQVVERAASALCWIGPRARSALPKLIELAAAEDRSDAARMTIVHAILKINPHAAQVSPELLATLPAITRVLEAGGFKQQGMAAECLKEFGPAAKDALPLLHRRLEPPSDDVDTEGLVRDYVQRTASEAIETIEAKPLK